MIFFEFGLVVEVEMPLTGISYLELWQPLRSVEQNHLCRFCRRHHEEQIYEIIVNLYHWFRRRCLLKIFLIWSSCVPFVKCSGTICAILKEGIMGNIHVKLYEI